MLKQLELSLGYIVLIKKLIIFPFRKGHRIYDQLKRMGVSTDWDRESFTMSEVGLIVLIKWFQNYSQQVTVF